MVDEQPPLTKEERRQRQKRLEQTRRRKTQEVAPRAVKVDSPPTDEAAPKSDSPPAPHRGRPPKPDVTAADVTGLKYFEKLAPLLERLHDVGCARDRAGNRELHYDEFCLLLLLGLFNPVVDSLRGLQQASELASVQKRLQLGRVSLGSFHEYARKSPARGTLRLGFHADQFCLVRFMLLYFLSSNPSRFGEFGP